MGDCITMGVRDFRFCRRSVGLRPTPKYPAVRENNSSDTHGSCAFVLASCANVFCSSRNLYVVKDCVTTLKGHVQSDASTPNLLLGQRCWELLCLCWQWCANGCNNSNNVDAPAVHRRKDKTHKTSTLLRYASAITEQKECWELLAHKFDRFQILRNNSRQLDTTCNRVCKRTQDVTSNNVASLCTGL